MKNKGTQFLTEAAVIGAIYVVLTLLFAPLSYGEIQIRFSEALTILPFFTPAAIPGLFVGCIIANLFGGAIPVDIIFGSIATLIGAVFTYRLRSCNRFLAPIPPIRAIRTSLRIRSKSSDSAYDAYRRYRRSSFLWCSRTDSSDSPSEIQKCDLQITENCITYDI